jgi:hypothetical protein
MLESGHPPYDWNQLLTQAQLGGQGLAKLLASVK